MEERLRKSNRIKGFYALVVRYGVEQRVACMPDLVDWASSWVGGLRAAWLLRRIRCSHSAVTYKLVTGDVMRSDYRLVHKLAAKRWSTIPQSLKECFVNSGWKRRKKRDGENKGREEYKRCVGKLNNTWFDMKSLLLPPKRSPARKDVREASRETPTTRKQDMPCSRFKEQTD